MTARYDFALKGRMVSDPEGLTPARAQPSASLLFFTLSAST